METAERYEITWLIRRLFRAMAAWADARLEGTGISAADRAVLEFLYPNEALPVPAIAERYQVSRQHVQVTVNRLLDRSLVETVSNPRHRRSPLVRLTRAGRTLFADVRAGDLAMIDRIFDDIPASRQRATRRTLKDLLEKLAEGEMP